VSEEQEGQEELEREKGERKRGKDDSADCTASAIAP